MEEFRDLLRQHVRELEGAYPERYSQAWFFLRYVKRIRKRALANPSPRACSGLMRGLMRYFVDSIEEDSELATRFAQILECHRYALRTERRV
jgi:hypothetical protein